MSTTSRNVVAAIAVLLTAILVVVVIANRGSGGSTSGREAALPSDTSTTPTSAGTTTTVPVDPTETPDDESTATTLASGDEVGVVGPRNLEGNSIMVPVRDLPLDVRVERVSGLADGDTVTVHIDAKAGSKIYGADARLCRGGALIENTADYAPTQGGQCVAAPLSSSSDAFVELAADEPYASLDVPFRVGTGTSSYQVQDGSQARITCGPGHPCTLVVKLQVPGGFGFESFDLTFG